MHASNGARAATGTGAMWCRAAAMFFAAAAALIGFGRLAHAASLDAALLPAIQAATFEVVQAKPTSDPIQYERPLPLDRLPFQERTDKYYSIGTAFAIGPNRYVTAGHVLNAGLGSLWGTPALRDSTGHVYAIDKVEAFDLRRDFVVFSLRDAPKVAPLPSNGHATLNQVVFAVGNALGTGVVIRDGLYTSDTPEDQDGAWKWMRFSAAASPGNSGGPLLDTNGKVIGIVLAKSANENLNFALPIHEVLGATSGKAVIDTRISYQLDVLDTTQPGPFKADFTLPLPLAGFYTALAAQRDATTAKLLAALLQREQPNLFPNGKGSAYLLNELTLYYDAPALIMRGSDGDWGRSSSSYQTYQLDANGKVRVASAGLNRLVHLIRPDSTDATTFYRDPKTRMDMVLRSGTFLRSVAGESIKVTSLGAPPITATHVDHWQRSWRVSIWPVPFLNGYLATYELPLPDGTAMLMRSFPATDLHDARQDLDELTNFMYVTYSGTLAQWKTFLADPGLSPPALRAIDLRFEYGQRFHYRSARVALDYPSSLQPIAPDNLLWLGFRYFLDHGKPVWDVGSFSVWKTPAADDHDIVTVQRHIAPPAGLNENLTSRWNKVASHEAPYDGHVFPEDGRTGIMGASDPAPGTGQPRVRFVGYLGINGSHPQDVMQPKFDVLMHGIEPIER